MFKPALIALGSAIVAVSSIGDVQAAQPEACITTAEDIRATLKDDLGLNYRFDEDGDILIEYKGGHNIWIIMEGTDHKHLDARGNGEICAFKILSFPVSSQNPEDFGKFKEMAQKYNELYKFKHYARKTKSGSSLALERNEFVSSEYSRAQFCEVYQVFAATLFAIAKQEGGN